MTLLLEIRRALSALGDPERAEGARKYMKSEMPYHGVPAPLFRKTIKPILAAHPLPSAKKWRSDVLAVWSGAKFREERYAAIELTRVRAAKAFQDLDALPMYERMIVEGAWWDYVDTLASHGVGTLLRNHPREMKKTMRAWSKCGDMWKRRTSIICQLTLKNETDLELLYDCIEPSLESKEFFLRKAIGWALRQYAWTDPREVMRYVRENEDRLSGLSKREALKNCPKK